MFYYKKDLLTYLPSALSYYLNLRSDTRRKSRLPDLNVLSLHYGGQLKTAVELEAGEKIDCKR